MTRIIPRRPTRDEFLQILELYYERVDRELREACLAPLFCEDPPERVENEAECWDPWWGSVPPADLRPFALDAPQESCRTVDRLLEIRGVPSPMAWIRGTKSPEVEGEWQ